MTVTNVFFKEIVESRRNSKKIWIDKGSNFQNKSMKSWLEGYGREMYSTNNERKSFFLLGT